MNIPALYYSQLIKIKDTQYKISCTLPQWIWHWKVKTTKHLSFSKFREKGLLCYVRVWRNKGWVKIEAGYGMKIPWPKLNMLSSAKRMWDTFKVDGDIGNENRCLATSTIFTFSSFCNRLSKLRDCRTLEMNIYMVNNPNWQESLAPVGYLQAWPKTWTRDCGKPTRSLITSFCVLQILLWHISSFGSTDIQLSSTHQYKNKYIPEHSVAFVFWSNTCLMCDCYF